MTNGWVCRPLTALIVVLGICALTDSRRLNGPLILPSRNEITLQNGQNFTLTCKGKSELQFMQQDIPEEPTGGLFNKTQTLSTISDGEYKYQVDLELTNVDQFAIGYYACFDDSVDGSGLLNNLTEEPNGTDHITYIYIYVNGTGVLFAPMMELVTPRDGSKVVIKCRPTTPDVKVTLLQDNADTNEQYSPKLGFVFDSDTISACVVKCVFQNRDGSMLQDYHIIITKPIEAPPKPVITGGSKFFLKGETFTINCSLKFGDIVGLSWTHPNSINIKENKNQIGREFDTTYSGLIIENATEENAGFYICNASNLAGHQVTRFEKIYLKASYINLSSRGKLAITFKHNVTIKLATEIDAYPPTFTHGFLRDGKQLNIDDKKYKEDRTKTGDIRLHITETQATDSANYTLWLKNQYTTKNITYVVRIKEKPVVLLGTANDMQYRSLENSTRTLTCQVIGFPPSDIVWIFTPDAGFEEEIMNSSQLTDESAYKRTASLDLPAKFSGNITCEATNELGTASVTQSFIVYEMENGFGIKNRENTWFSQNQDVILTCVASINDFKDATWFANDKELGSVVQSNGSLSRVATLKMDQVSISDSGQYTCSATRINGTKETESIVISVTGVRSPVITEPSVDETKEVHIFQSITLPCRADGVPPPTLKWLKNGDLLTNLTKVKIYMNSIDHTTINSTIVIPDLKDDDMAIYECVANSDDVVTRRTYKLVRKVDPTNMTLVSVIISIFFVLILLVGYLTWKIKKEKQFKRELRAAGLLYFKKGVTKSLNPDLGIDEQAELLPYDEKFEFPSEKLKLGKQLGAGAFGVVYKAEARGIINAEETTEVAVKMVKKTADNMYIKALASELKIMVHLGKHINIVNLLGACTKNVGKRELIVIVEYCKFGNIHNYMQRHREVFIDQLTDNKEKNLGRVNRGFYCSTGSTGAQSDYFDCNNTQDTDHTMLNTANTSRSGRKVSEGYVQPEWRTNYESDYSFDGRNPRPLTSRDLLVWAFQIARGMEYLANRKVLHGDLAARNVLLADDNIVKICDFGLARNIYNNDEYQKKENSLLPVKWLAIECMTDRIFSTQSDVWSFGIVLWELFSLAKTPYPNMAPASLLQWLSDGNRLAKPSYADDKLYEVMLKCWEKKPTSRPSFGYLQERLGAFLEDNVRNHYVDLNAVYTDMNVKADGQEDYLNMVCSPDYNNLVTPSPHHYVNQPNFFPQTPTKLDEEGYLQMSPASNQGIFSPRLHETKFDFEPHKFNPKVSDASSLGSELTPMLTLNNLPRSGSDSDHEGNVSPNLNKCTSIKEEADEVFETKQNNVKNAYNTAVTNPTYIPFNIEIEKKPKDIINTYVNVANGLVK